MKTAADSMWVRKSVSRVHAGSSAQALMQLHSWFRQTECKYVALQQACRSTRRFNKF